ncbi:hybrid sensor histidine kinase/response regulator [Hydrococcus rivularis NIES-593]|uniref:Circadian input-output histidine kinase CikA n=1 Tax=Hydrococcus rivularis NIES-593 TaxID=1921803 RepID=A0A1U7HBY9_9CYAN|nr:ATP-binding protein [Hydrococcus rivularis]OKH21093.1 hybrid sensor histidine kinase/response regulator [Hydrococcus rivularis NIES-593]
MSGLIEKNLEKTSLRRLLIIPFVLQVFAAVGLTGYFSWRNGQKAIDDLASQLQQEASLRIDQHLDSYLAVPHQINQINEHAVRLGLLQLNDLEKLGQYFWKQMKVFPIGYINYGDAKGHFIGVERLNNGELRIVEDASESSTRDNIYETDNYGKRVRLIESVDVGADHREEDWYKGAAEAGKPLWSSIYQWEDKPEVLSISLSYPVHNLKGQFLGVIGVDLILSQISQYLRLIKFSPGSRIFIVERNGLLVASSSREQPYIVVEKEARRLNVFNSKEPPIRATAEYLRDLFGNFNGIKSARQLDFRSNGERQFVQVTPWQDKYGLDWLVVVVTPESDFMAQIDANTRTTILLCLGALAIATVLGIYTSRWISQPILHLSKASQAIASGQLDQQVRVEGASELRTLARSFNQMAQQLKESFTELQKTNAELEIRVEQRTAQFKKAVQAAEAANRAKGQFLANISQELRTSLNSVIGYSNLLMNDRALSPQQAKGAEIIQRSSTQLLTLINDILDFSKAETSKVELELSDFHFPSFLEEICSIIEMRSQEKKLLFQCQTTDDLPTGVRADEKRLRQVLMNLLGNAVKFTDQGQILFKVSAIGTENAIASLPQQQIRFQIIDTGIGIDPSDLEKIFQPFEPIGDRERLRGGIGMGLAMSKQLLELMGSQLQVISQPGQGSIFWFEIALPVVEIASTTQANAIARVKGYLGNRRKILVADDKQENRSLLHSWLDPLGFEVVMAKDGEQGLTVARQLKPDLIITDLFMGVKTGLMMAREIRQTDEIKDVPIIAVSASTAEMIEEASRRVGCNTFLPKPIDEQKLLVLLQKYLQLEWIYEGQ